MFSKPILTKAMKASAIRFNLAENNDCEWHQITMSETTEGWNITIPDIGRYHLKESNYFLGPNFWGPPITPTDVQISDSPKPTE